MSRARDSYHRGADYCAATPTQDEQDYRHLASGGDYAIFATLISAQRPPVIYPDRSGAPVDKSISAALPGLARRYEDNTRGHLGRRITDTFCTLTVIGAQVLWRAMGIRARH